MSSIVVSGDTSGSVTLSAPAVAGSTVLTLPSVSGTVLTSASSQVTGPAFSAYRGVAQTITTATFTKVQLSSEEFDTNSNFDSTTNYRFTPTVAGYYQVNATINAVSTLTLTRTILAFQKNGVQYSRGIDIAFASGTNPVYLSMSDLIYFNGSTDYLELYTYLVGTGTLTLSASGTGEVTRMSGSLARSA